MEICWWTWSKVNLELRLFSCLLFLKSYPGFRKLINSHSPKCCSVRSWGTVGWEHLFVIVCYVCRCIFNILNHTVGATKTKMINHVITTWKKWKSDTGIMGDAFYHLKLLSQIASDKTEKPNSTVVKSCSFQAFRTVRLSQTVKKWKTQRKIHA